MALELPTAGWDCRHARGSVIRLDTLVPSHRAAIDAAEDLGPRKGAPPGTAPTWAVVVLKDNVAQARAALEPLLAHRAAIASPARGGQPPGFIAIKPPPPGNPLYWVERLRSAVDNKLPEYLLFVGGPDSFPFEVQALFDLACKTGRLDASEVAGGPLSWTACRRWAEKVVAYELGAQPPPRALLYSVETDVATRLSHQRLTAPLADHLEGPTRLFADEARRAGLIEALRSPHALVFTASHGLEFPPSKDLWGALTDATGAAGAFSVRDVPAGGGFAEGAVVVSFACFSAGVPLRSHHRAFMGEGEENLPEAPFVAALPRLLLGRHAGPVAFVGHVDRATSHSFHHAGGLPDLEPFEHLLGWFGQGTLGQALSTLRARAQASAAEVLHKIAGLRALHGDANALAGAWREWIRFRDLEGYMLLGDPATRLAPLQLRGA